jgi:hypothetical protein
MKRRNKKASKMPSPILWRQVVRSVIPGATTLYGPAIELPIPPFPGLRIGSLMVERVSIMQGPNGTDNVIDYRPIVLSQAEELLKRGWQLPSIVKGGVRPSRVASSA